MRINNNTSTFCPLYLPFHINFQVQTLRKVTMKNNEKFTYID